MLTGSFIRGANPKWYEFDATAAIFTPDCYASFLSNVFPYLPLNVFQDPNGDVVWGQPIQFLASGSLPDNIYFQPDIEYRIEFRRGPNQWDPLLIPPIENYVANGDTGSDTTTISTDTDNQMTNPQFLLTNFGASVTITTAGTYNIAPGWFLVLAGTATGITTTVSQVAYPSNTAIDDNPPNPPFFLKIASANWTQVTLYQQFQNGALYENGSISVSFLARSDTNLQQIGVNYVDSNADSIAVIPLTNIPLSFTTIANAIPLGASTNPNVAPNAFVQLQFVLPTNGTIEISNIQFYGNPGAPVTLPYQQTTPERQLDQTFHYYRNSIVLHPKTSILTGWNFSLNPYQFSPTALTTMGGQIAYVADQTVIYAKGGAGALQTGRAVAAENGYFQVNAVASTTLSTQFAMIQYIAPQTIQQYWQAFVSSLVRAAIGTNVNSQVHIKLRLIYRNSLPPTISNVEPIASWGVIDPVFATGWTAIVPNNDPAYLLSDIASIEGGLSMYPFEQMQLPVAVTFADSLAIVIYTTDNLSSAGSPDSVVFASASLVPNRFAIESSPETFDESLRRCQFYFETSYNLFTPISSVTRDGALSVIIQNTATQCVGMERSFKSVKNIIPTMTWYSPDTGSANTLHDITTPGEVAVATTANGGQLFTGYPVLAAAAGATDALLGHFVARARLGISGG